MATLDASSDLFMRISPCSVIVHPDRMRLPIRVPFRRSPCNGAGVIRFWGRGRGVIRRSETSRTVGLTGTSWAKIADCAWRGIA